MASGQSFLDVLGTRALVFDGATGTQYQAAGLEQPDFTLVEKPEYPDAVNAAAKRLNGEYLEGCNEILVFTRPDVVEEVHLQYLRAGSDIVETNTFGSTSVVLADYDIAELTYEVSLAAARIARKACDSMSTPEKPRFVCGALGPGTKLVTLGQVGFDELVDTYADSFVGLIEGGADVLLLETMQDLLMSKAGVLAAKRAMEKTGKKLPLICQVTMEQTGTMLLGSEMAAALNYIETQPEVVAIGLNCATGPQEMIQHIRFLSENSTRPLSIQPNAGLPMMEGGKAVYKLSPDELAEFHHRFVTEFGVAIVGGCCGTTPNHIEAVARRVQGATISADAHWSKVREVFPNYDFTVKTQDQMRAKKLVGCSSLYLFQPYEQDNSFLIIGEKTNANGSKAFREMLAAENWDGLTELAREQEAEGSHLLDVCAAYVGRDEKRDMHELLGRYNQHLTVPIMIDSTEVPVIEESLKRLAGKPIINSINFEDGDKRTAEVLQLCKEYGAGIVALTIDEDGMAKTVEKKLEITHRIMEWTRKYGLPDQDVFIDALTFTLGSGDEEFRQAGIATIEAIRQIKEHYPLVNTTLGVSNISFGLKPAARQVLNSAFLHYCLEAGMTSAIVHFSKIKPDHKIEPEIWKIASDLVYDRREFAKA